MGLKTFQTLFIHCILWILIEIQLPNKNKYNTYHTHSLRSFPLVESILKWTKQQQHNGQLKVNK